jgi:hypothetical protein
MESGFTLSGTDPGQPVKARDNQHVALVQPIKNAAVGDSGCL